MAAAAGSGHGYGEDGVGAEARFGGGTRRGKSFCGQARAGRGIESGDGFGDSLLALATGFEDTLPDISICHRHGALRLRVRQWRRRKARARQALAIEDDVGFDGGIAARIDDLAGMYFDDLGRHDGLLS